MTSLKKCNFGAGPYPFLQGGASTQFSMLANNFLKKKGAYLDAGYFAVKAINEASHFGSVEVLDSSSDKQYSYIPDIEMTLVIVKDTLLNTVDKSLPGMADYRIFRDNKSLFNTPPVFSIYVSMLNLLWLKEQGGVAAIEQRNIKKSQLLYNEVEAVMQEYEAAVMEKQVDLQLESAK